ncbi:hypothetical protein RvY_10900 [Ramazzottius varieornatus]|uniref:K Homology domain-containing protein n=1 Tax=Ramazzottius varieornatus TaxID=947166 RepID=A0A1D1VEB1_RAMVA|nr:hypothetical protein RvY_10900 [Ramazzottius varieornatus]
MDHVKIEKHEDFAEDHLLNGTNGTENGAENAENGSAGGEGFGRPSHSLSEDTEEYIKAVEAEIKALNGTGHLIKALAERELARIRAGEISEQGYVIIHKEIPVRVIKKVLIPIKEYPKINFVGRLLGPKGQTLKTLQANTRARIMIFGRGSMWDKNKEEEARNSGDAKYAHLNEDLHIYVEITAYPVEVQARFTHVLNELKKFLDPNHPGHFQASAAGDIPPPMPPGYRPAGPGMRGPPPQHYRGPRPQYGGPRHSYPPRGAAPTADYSSYYAQSVAGDASAYQAPGTTADANAAYGYTAYPAQADYSQPAATSYDQSALAAQANQYAAAASAQQQAQQPQQVAYQQPQQTQYAGAPSAYGVVAPPGTYSATPAYGAQPATGYAAPGYAVAPAGYAGWAAPTAPQQPSPPGKTRPAYDAGSAAKKPRMAAPGYGY